MGDEAGQEFLEKCIALRTLLKQKTIKFLGVNRSKCDESRIWKSSG